MHGKSCHRQRTLGCALIALGILVAGGCPYAQTEMTFEQAQVRAHHARTLMDTAERKVRNLERREKSAYRTLSAAQQLYEEAKQAAQKASEELQAAQQEAEEARQRWEAESANLRRIHRQRE
jgi:chromosome segregation ATPase